MTEPPELKEVDREKMRCATGEKVVLEYFCPHCDIQLDLDRDTWVRSCPECDYTWKDPNI